MIATSKPDSPSSSTPVRSWKAFEIDGDPAFPFYQVSVRYQMDGAPPPGWLHAVVEGRPDRQWSCSQKRQPLYYLEPPAEHVIRAEAQAFWDAIKDEVHGPRSYGPEGTPKIPHYSDVEIKIGEAKYETWILDWFSHFTFRVGRSDAELLASFQRYVSRIMSGPEDYDVRKGKLMGAEDRYRWRGDARKDTDPPCGCEHCLKAGIARIDH